MVSSTLFLFSFGRIIFKRTDNGLCNLFRPISYSLRFSGFNPGEELRFVNPFQPPSKVTFGKKGKFTSGTLLFWKFLFFTFSLGKHFLFTDPPNISSPSSILPVCLLFVKFNLCDLSTFHRSTFFDFGIPLRCSLLSIYFEFLHLNFHLWILLTGRYGSTGMF